MRSGSGPKADALCAHRLQEKQQHKAAPEVRPKPHVAVAVPKKEHQSPPEHEKPKVHKEVVVPAAGHGDHDAKKAKAHHRKRMVQLVCSGVLLVADCQRLVVG